MKRRFVAALFALFLPVAAFGHIGSPNAIYEGLAGPVPVRVTVRVPGVVPGLADINVRVLTNGVKRVTALPIHWRAGVKGAPPPDVCKAVPGEPGLYHAQLWLMEHGAFNVGVAVETEQGSGKVSVPVNALATTRLPMDRFLGTLLTGIGLLLFALMATIAGAAVRESVLKTGETPGRLRLWFSRGTVVIASVVLATSLYGGWNWWQKVDRDYRNNRMHQPLPARAEVLSEGGLNMLRFSIVTTNVSRRNEYGLQPLVPDHGKLMHLFLVREPDMAALAHLHPARRATNTFESALPPLPAGRYSVYADVTHESGFSQTLTATVELPEPNTTKAFAPSDADDSWFASGSVITTNYLLGDGLTMIWDRAAPLIAGRETTLRFRVLDAQGEPADVEPYMSMLAHAIVRRDDGSVFTHLHPAGSISVASQQVFQLRAGEKPRGRITPELMEKLCLPPGPELRRLPISFPYEFPKAGRYRIWVQLKVAGAVRTAVFDADVAPAA